jgi:anti-sigma factor (TIGR02949 family)
MGQLDRMTCEEAFTRLDDFLDKELGAEEMRLVQEHLDTCAACAREYDFERSVLDGVRDKLRRIQVPGDLLSRISRRLADPGR